MQTVLLPVGADLYSIRIESVREVLAAPTVTRLATAPASVLGLINVRGEIVPLWDTASLLGVGAIQEPAFAAVIITEQGPAALALTAFPRRAELGEPIGPSERPGADGIYRVDQRVVVLLNVEGLFVPDRLGESDVHLTPLPSRAG